MPFRHFISMFAAALVTVLLFFLMAALIAEQTRPDDPEDIVRVAPPVVEQTAREESSQKSERAEAPRAFHSGGSRPPVPSTKEPEPKDASLIQAMTTGGRRAIKPVMTFEVVVDSPDRTLVPRSEGSRRGHGFIDGTSIEIEAYAADFDGEGQCGMLFTVAPDSSLEEMGWFRCDGNEMADAAEKALMAWIKANPDAYEKLPKKNRHLIMFHFEAPEGRQIQF